MVLYSSLQTFNQFISASAVLKRIEYIWCVEYLWYYWINLITWDTSATAFVLEIVETVYHGLEICTDWCKNYILCHLWQVFFLYAEKWSGHGLTSRCGSYAYVLSPFLKTSYPCCFFLKQCHYPSLNKRFFSSFPSSAS